MSAPNSLSEAASRLKTSDLINSPDHREEAERLGLALEVRAPALFVVWQKAVDHVAEFIDPCVRAGAEGVWVARVEGSVPESLWLDGLREKLASLSQRTVIVLLGCLSAVPLERRATFNAGRNFWVDIDRVVLFVEPIDREPELKRDFPDVFSLVRDEVKLYPPVAPARHHQGEVESVDDKGVVCWVEVGSEERVRVRFDSRLLAHLRPFSGMEFVWAPDGTELRPEQFSRLHGKRLTPAERAELNQLRLSFRERLERGEILKDEGE